MALVQVLSSFKKEKGERIVANADTLIDEIEKLGTVTDNWSLLRDILKMIVNLVPNVPYPDKDLKKKGK